VKNKKNISLSKALKDKRFIIILVLLILVDLLPIYVGTNFKVIYMPIINNDHFLSYCLIVNTITNILGTFFWGWLGDSQGIYFSILIVVISNIIVSCFCLLATSNASLLLFAFFLGLTDRGM
jgi:MFS family permease